MDSVTNDEQQAVAFLFEENGGSRRAIARDVIGERLPHAPRGWSLSRSFLLAVEHVPPVDVEPEPVIRAVRTDGYYCWDPSKARPKGTGQ